MLERNYSSSPFWPHVEKNDHWANEDSIHVEGAMVICMLQMLGAMLIECLDSWNQGQ